MLQSPSTPLQNKVHKCYSSFKPANSSPLAPTNSSPGSSPIAAVQARRRSQYKAYTPNVPLTSLSCSRSSSSSTRPSRLAGLQFGEDGDDSQKAFLRTRLKQRCFERASKARERAVKKKRFMSSSEAGSDDMDATMDIDMDDDDDEGADPMFDELFSRIMRNTQRKTQHAFMYSYDREVGSDPTVEESAWEAELAGQDDAAEDLGDDPALQAYLEEQAAFADFADIPAEDLFDWNDLEDDLLSGDVPQRDSGNDMDLS
ncbi:hypothetical protein B0H15DRAFT_50469 [Mycena belliarum]|uniref:Uncharacterized protein n=1 Tax=Mycena belliarum TaxID=1033014 RepID=A0AAD6UB49_9AGAR|nr:hypothetical protein B0H15DRAFT_50469 [Mycena belliae]